MTKPFDPSKPFTTRDGRPARLLGTLKTNSAFPIIAAVTDSFGTECFHTYTADGFYWADRHHHDLDLINISCKRTVWIALVEGAVHEKVIYADTEGHLRSRIECCGYEVLDGPFCRTFEVPE